MAVVLGIGAGIAWLGRMLLVVPAVWLYASVLTPIGHGIAWLGAGHRRGSWWPGAVWCALVWLLKARVRVAVGGAVAVCGRAGRASGLAWLGGCCS